MPVSNDQARFTLIMIMLLLQLLTLIEEIFFVQRFSHSEILVADYELPGKKQFPILKD
jgi:hypothetical protein